MEHTEKITISNLSKKFQNESEIQYNDITFKSGESCMILGASGCGKSTLLNIIAGLVGPTSGEVIYADEKETNIWNMSSKERDMFRIKNIGYIYQDFKLIEDMSVEDNIGILKIQGVDVSSMDEVLKKLGMFEYKKKKIKYLSGGQKQRVAIARALVKNPPIILADEPTGNLNFEIGNQITKELVDNSKDKILIVVSHDTRLAKYFNKVIDLSGGSANV